MGGLANAKRQVPNRIVHSPYRPSAKALRARRPPAGGRPVARGKKMVRIWAALLAALMVCLPIGGELTPAWGVDLGNVHWRGMPDKPPPPADLMVAYPCLLVLSFILLRVEHTRGQCRRRGHSTSSGWRQDSLIFGDPRIRPCIPGERRGKS